jgi:hypothetical protein
VRSNVEYRENVWMIELAGNARFALKPGAAGRLGSQIFGKNLDGDVAIQAKVSRPVYLTHATSS